MKKLSLISLFVLALPFAANAQYSHTSQKAENCAIGVFMNYMKAHSDITSFTLNADFSDVIERVDQARYQPSDFRVEIEGEIKERGKKPVKVEAEFDIRFARNTTRDALGRVTVDKNYLCDFVARPAPAERAFPNSYWFQITENEISYPKVNIEESVSK